MVISSWPKLSTMVGSNNSVTVLQKIRDRWFEGSPKTKRGVTERYVVFGEARRWMIDQIRDLLNGLVLDLGSRTSGPNSRQQAADGDTYEG